VHTELVHIAKLVAAPPLASLFSCQTNHALSSGPMQLESYNIAQSHYGLTTGTNYHHEHKLGD